MLGLPPKNQPPLGPPPRSAREKVRAAWYGVDIAAVEKTRPTTARSAAELVQEALNHLNLDRRRLEAEVLRAWSTLIDPNIAAHAQPTGLRNGTLFVRVDSSVWLSELSRYRAKEILDQLQNCFGPELIKRISFRLG
ncbi:MAG: DUF721 domain-containing protein [Verrucomicrobiae bacterium]|nr:DUF721 domain-containing protein [Verrucomicrobiae bacterium]MCX7722432.1 DUF721 domain-containing protein [Verrucomicrobiae bacterium]MDW7980853.1 DUF721 domain-containing protein [Verrucomicrobiales bacterium]